MEVAEGDLQGTVLLIERSKRGPSLSVDLDFGNGSVRKVQKSFWTCAVEAAFEYSRIVYDIFPHEPSVCVGHYGNTVEFMNSWRLEDQNLETLVGILGKFPRAPDEPALRLKDVISKALEVFHTKPFTAVPYPPRVLPRHVPHWPRIIILRPDVEEVDLKEDDIQQIIHDFNIKALELREKTLVKVEIVILHVSSSSETSSNPVVKKRMPGSVVVKQVMLSTLQQDMVSLVKDHFHLRSARVSNIPMKDTSSESKAYDVVLLFQSLPHALPWPSSSLPLSAQSAPLPSPSSSSKTSSKNNVLPSISSGGSLGGGLKHVGASSDELPLSWRQGSSKKETTSSQNDIFKCCCMHSVSPLDVTASYTQCLIKYVLAGKPVQLVGPRSSSYTLASHKGHIYLHCISACHTLIDSVPSIMMLAGGQVMDYRISDMQQIMETFLFTADSPTQTLSKTQLSELIHRYTLGFSFVKSKTALFADTDGPLYNLLGSVVHDLRHLEVALHLEESKEKLKTFHEFMVDNSEKLFPTIRSLAQRAESYRLAWRELLEIARAVGEIVPPCNEIYLLMSEYDPDPKPVEQKSKRERSRKHDVEEEWEEYDDVTSMTEREVQDLNSNTNVSFAPTNNQSYLPSGHARLHPTDPSFPMSGPPYLPYNNYQNQNNGVGYLNVNNAGYQSSFSSMPGMNAQNNPNPNPNSNQSNLNASSSSVGSSLQTNPPTSSNPSTGNNGKNSEFQDGGLKKESLRNPSKNAPVDHKQFNYCYEFSNRGYCFRGDSCKYPHDTSSSNQPRNCYNCGRLGHFARDCPGKFGSQDKDKSMFEYNLNAKPAIKRTFSMLGEEEGQGGVPAPHERNTIWSLWSDAQHTKSSARAFAGPGGNEL